MLAQKTGDNVPHRNTVQVHKTKELNHEYTQRSRSFLYVSIDATIGRMLNFQSVRFNENGVISLNLPVCAQVVGGRAPRTTHPRGDKGLPGHRLAGGGRAFHHREPVHLENQG